MKINFKHTVYTLTAFASLVSITGCEGWGEICCSTGRLAAQTAATALLEKTDAGKKLTPEQKEAIVIVAGELGCLLSCSPVLIDEYVQKKREEYATEAAYLQAHIDDLNKSIARADKDIAWLENQNVTLKKQAGEIKKLPALKGHLSSQFKDAARKRGDDAQKLEKYLRDERDDSKLALRTTSDEEKKTELRNRIKELDGRIESTKKVRKELMKTSAQVSYA